MRRAIGNLDLIGQKVVEGEIPGPIDFGAAALGIATAFGLRTLLGDAVL